MTLFIQSLGYQRCLPGPNPPIFHSFPYFLVCISEISSSSHGALWLQPPSLSLSPSCSLVLHSPTLSCHPPALPPQTAAFFSTDLILTGLVSCCWNHSIASSPLQQGPWGELCPPEKSLNNNPVSSEESWYQMEARSRDWLKVKSKLMGAEKIHVGDGREACDLDLSTSNLSACDVPSTLSLRPSAGIRTES